jgi:plastocyanin
MKRALIVLISAGLAAPLFAGDLHGKVAAKGVRDSADAVVYVAAITGKTFPPPTAHAKIDQLNLVFAPHVLPVLAGTTVDFLNSDKVLHNVFSPDTCAEKFNLGTWPQGQTKSYTFKSECAATLLCKVHPEMEAFVIAVPTAVTVAGATQADFEIAR